GSGETVAVPQGRAERRAAASSVAPIERTYRGSLRPCIATPIAPLRRAPFHQTLLAVAIDDAAATQVVRRQLDLDAVAGKDPDPVAPHLPGRVAECLVTIVERDLEEAVAERLDDFAL